jgi:hypothetical protein
MQIDPVFVTILIFSVIATFVMQWLTFHWGTRIVGITPPSYAKALAVTALSIIPALVFCFLAFLIGPVGAFMGLISNLFITAILAMGIYRADFSKSICATLIGWALLPIAFIPIGFLFVAIQVIRGASTDIAPFIYALF